MTETVLFWIAWYAIGLFLCLTWWRRELDVELGDLIVMLLVAGIGPVALVLHLLAWLERLNIVVIRRK